MAATGYTPIQLYYSTTASAAPTAANLLPGELGLNITDGKLYYEDNLGAVQLIASKAGAAGSVTSVSGTGTVNGITLSGTVTSSGSLTLGGTLSGVSLTTQVTGTLPVANGGTGGTTFTANNVLLGNGTSAFQVVAPGTSGNVLTSDGTTWVSSAPGASLFGDTDSATPYETSLGYQAGNAVTTGQYATFVGYNSGSSTTTGNYNTAVGAGALNTNISGSNNTAIGFGTLGTNTQSGSTAVGMQALGTAQTTSSQNTALGYRAGQTLSSGSDNIFIGYNAGNPGLGNDLSFGSNNILIGNAIDLGTYSISNRIRIGAASHIETQLFGAVDLSGAIIEAGSVVTSAPPATITFDFISRSVLLYTANATANWIVNVRGDSVNSFNNMTSTGDAVTIAIMVTNGATAYYPTSFQVDGGTKTVKWQGGTAPTAGNANSVDAYVYSIIKTGNAAYTILGSQTKFA